MKEKFVNYQKKKEVLAKKLWFRLLNQLINLILAAATVIPLLYKICTTIPFSFEVNDDSVIMQILDGSFTGTPDAHGIFLKYPLSWLISFLYKKNPVINIWKIHLTDVNWYLGTIVVLYGFALTAVLYRLLNHFRCNRFLICGIYAMGFLAIWLPCFSALTFSTAAGFCGCMAILYLALETKEEAWRPWNLLVLGILILAAYCLRTQCCYMVLPFLLIEFIIKYNTYFLKSLKPWIALCVIALLCAGAFYLNDREYGSQGWKNYYTYNHARSYLQDYKGFPEYEENQEFYSSQGIGEEARDAMAYYTYCMVDDFKTDWVLNTYDYQKGQEPVLSWREKIEGSWKKAWRLASESKQAFFRLRFYSFFFWLVLIPLIPATLILRCRAGMGKHLLYVLQTVFFALLTAAEWIYLAINGRFPQRVEECIRLLTFTAAFVMVCHFLETYKEVWNFLLHCLLQLLLIAVLLSRSLGFCNSILANVQGNQEYQQIYGAEKGEVLEYCGKHPENFYVLDTSSFTKVSLPTDDMHQMNWIMSGSWSAYTPLYGQKLKDLGTEGIGSDFLLRDNVYLITRGPKKIGTLMGRPDEEVEYKIADEFCSAENSFFEIYKIKAVKK
ncbi:MAG: hypothetical protein IKX76_02850 [Eubacterium sp.]|nr:hypothetical protein [Eubacterium sp.]